MSNPRAVPSLHFARKEKADLVADRFFFAKNACLTDKKMVHSCYNLSFQTKSTNWTMSINSTQIRDGFGRELRVMRGKAPILKNAGLIPIQYWLTNRHFFFEKLEKYLGPTLGIYQDTSKVF